jgi:hypothetical protein
VTTYIAMPCIRSSGFGGVSEFGRPHSVIDIFLTVLCSIKCCLAPAYLSLCVSILLFARPQTFVVEIVYSDPVNRLVSNEVRGTCTSSDSHSRGLSQHPSRSPSASSVCITFYRQYRRLFQPHRSKNFQSQSTVEPKLLYN